MGWKLSLLSKLWEVTEKANSGLRDRGMARLSTSVFRNSRIHLRESKRLQNNLQDSEGEALCLATKHDFQWCFRAREGTWTVAGKIERDENNNEGGILAFNLFAISVVFCLVCFSSSCTMQVQSIQCLLLDDHHTYPLCTPTPAPCHTPLILIRRAVAEVCRLLRCRPKNGRQDKGPYQGAL